MAFAALLIGAVLIVAAIRNSQGALFSALRQDVPEFAIWAAAIVALGVIGFIPGLKPTSRALLVLVFVVIVLANYQTVLDGFTSAWKGAAGQAQGNGDALSSSGSGGGLGLDLSSAETLFQGFSGGQSSGTGFTSGGSV